jgi:response regulator RpfG family c-di-GMP phosphodiesterase
MDLLSEHPYKEERKDLDAALRVIKQQSGKWHF